MVPLLVFYIHTIAAATTFTRRWQESGWAEGLLGVAFIVLIFMVGWSMATFVSRLLMEQAGFCRWFDRDAFALSLLTVVEAIAYVIHTRRKRRRMVQAG